MTGQLCIAPTPTSVAHVTNAGRPALAACWADIHGTDPPKNLSLSFLRQAIAFELQSNQSGRLSAKLRGQINRRIVQLKQQMEGGPGSNAVIPVSKQVTTLKPGARLVRDWNGKTWVVDVTAQGFELQGQSYASLTAIAKKITGAHWSGPRFFGLNGPSKSLSKAVERGVG